MKTLLRRETLVGIGSSYFSNVPIETYLTGSSLSCGVVANTWHDLDQTGSASARNLDIVIPFVKAGMKVCIIPDLISNASSAAYINMDIWTIVAGTAVHQFGEPGNPSNGGIPGWIMASSTFSRVTGPSYYTIQSGDIENGSVRLRLRDMNSTTTARTVIGTSGFHIKLAGIGPFG